MLKMNKNKPSRTPSLLAPTTLLLTFLLAGCGGGGSDNEPPVVDDPPATDPPATGATVPNYNENYLSRTVQDDIFYFVMVDRFANGSTENDEGSTTDPISSGGLNKADKAWYHGGDIAGLKEKLSYIKKLGATAIWMTPVLRNQAVQGDSAAYHGYWTLDYTEVDPHFGDNDELKEFIDEAHDEGLKVFFDVIINHTADVIKYQECHNPDGSYKDNVTSCDYKSLAQLEQGDTYTPFTITGTESAKSPAWLNNMSLYHNQGDSTFSGENSVYGDFFGLDDLDTNNPDVVTGMIDIFKNLITEFKPDGFRIDTVKHVNIEFWQAFSPAITQHAIDAGISNFQLFGEVFEGNPAVLSRYTTEGKLPAVLDFAFQGAASSVFAGTGNADSLANVFAADDLYNDGDSTANELMNFIGNHDIGRIGHSINQSFPDISDTDKVKRSLLAHGFMFFARGVPVIYYGDEQGFNGDGEDQDAREDMMPSLVAEYNDNDLFGTTDTTADDNFNEEHPLYIGLNQFAHIYHSHKALRRGIHHSIETNNDAVYAFTRIDNADKKDYIVVFNPTTTTQNIAVNAPSPTYKSVWRGDNDLPEEIAAESNTITLSLQPLSFVIYRATEKLAASNNTGFTLAGIEDNAMVAGNLSMNMVPDVDSILPLVRFTTEVSVNNGPYTTMSIDQTQPFVSNIDVSHYPNGSELKLRVTADNLDGSSSVKMLNVIVENRVPVDINLHYQNGNNREWLYAIDDTGHFQGPLNVEEITTGINWTNNTTALLLFFTDYLTLDNGQTIPTFDKPVYLTRDTAVSLSTEQSGNLIANLYLNNDHQFGSTQNDSDNLPTAIPITANDPAPLPDSANDGNHNNDLYVRGGINGWGVDDPMAYLGFSTYYRSINVAAGDGEYKFADADWSPTNIGAPVTPEGITASANPGNLLNNFPVTGLYDFWLQRTNWNDELYHLPVISKNTGPFNQAIYVKGSMNGWATSEDYRLSWQVDTNGNDVYQGEFTLPSGTHEFKLASDNWSIDLTSTDDTGSDIQPGTSEPVGNGQGLSNMQLDASQDARWRFTLSQQADGNWYLDVLQTQVIGEDVPPLDQTLYLKGELDGWSDGFAFNYVGSGHYSVTVYADETVLAGQPNQNDDDFWNFKIADLNWSVINLGGPTSPDFSLATPVVLTNSSDSSNIDLPLAGAGLYTFDLNMTDITSPTLTVSWSEAQQVSFHYYREAADYDGWGLHLWGDDLHPFTLSELSWTNPLSFSGVDNFGVYSNLYVTGQADIGMIVHKGDEKDPGPDMILPVAQGTSFWMNSGDSTVYTSESEAIAAR